MSLNFRPIFNILNTSNTKIVKINVKIGANRIECEIDLCERYSILPGPPLNIMGRSGSKLQNKTINKTELELILFTGENIRFVTAI